MSVAAAQPTTNGNHDAGSDPNADQSPSRFTAVNGRESSGPALNGSSESHTASTPNHERNSHSDHPREPVQQVTPEPTDGSDKPGSSAREPEDHRVDSGYRSAGENPNKRKRSMTPDRPRSPSTSYHSHSVSRSPVSRASENVAPLSQVIDMNGGARSSAAPDRYALSDRPEVTRSESNGSAWENYRSQLSTHGHRLPPNLDSSDAHLAETLQRDVHGSTSTTKPWEHADRAQSDPAAPHPSQAAQYAQDPSQSSQSQGPPKRKRIFSNRTKTGCLTCRRRKKKCDEQHPICNNCTRGGFPCEGYASRSTWQRSANSKPPIPLQSKDRYQVPNHYETTAQRHEFRQPSTAGPDSEASRLSVEEADRGRGQRLASPSGGASRKSWLASSWSTAGPPFPDRSAPKHDAREGPPMSEPPRPEQAKADYQLAPRVRDISHGAPGKPGMPVFQPSLEPRPPHPAHIDPTNYPAQAQLALSMERHLTPKHNGRSEKDKMFSNELYRPSDPELVQDRERCKAALWRFTNAGNPLYGISTEERTRLLREVFVPPSQRKGSLGPGTVIEAPFTCHYGYNINIGADVFISQNCLVVDDCGVSIGANTWIGPNVTILSAQASPEMQERKGAQICYRGSPVMIYMDCYIGAGVTILPGTIIGRGVCIAPGQIVSGRITDYDTIGTIPQF